jgi:HEAT repeat protein
MVPEHLRKAHFTREQVDVLDWTIDFNDIILAVYWLAAAVAVLSLLLVVQVMSMRRLARSREERIKDFRKEWSAILTPPGRHVGLLPAVFRADVPTFMMMWNTAQDTAYRIKDHDEAARTREHLNGIARRLRMDTIALSLLQKRDVTVRLQAVEMLGHLGEVTATPALRSLADSPNAVLSFAAARALLQINHAFAERFVGLMSERHDWSLAKLQAVVQDEAGILASPITDLVRTSPPATSRELVQYLRFFEPGRSLPVVRHLIATVTDPGTLTAALKVLALAGTPVDAPLAAKLATHEDWRVRVQVSNALGKLGDASQIGVVTSLLDDAHWWVRYRSAQALGALTKEDSLLRTILQRTQDRYARDILTQIIAERQPAFQGGAS